MLPNAQDKTLRQSPFRGRFGSHILFANALKLYDKSFLKKMILNIFEHYETNKYSVNWD